MTYGTVEDGVILPVPATVFSPTLRIDVAFEVDRPPSPCWRLAGRRGRYSRGRCRRGAGGRGSVSRAGAWSLLAARPFGSAATGLGLGGSVRSRPAHLVLGGIEEVVGLVRRLGLGPFFGGGCLLAGLGLRGSGFLRRFFGLNAFGADLARRREGRNAFGANLARRREPTQLFRRGVEQIVRLIGRLGLWPFVGSGRFLAGLGVGGIGLSGRALRLGRRSLGCDRARHTLARCLLLGLRRPARFGGAARLALDG